MLFSSFRSALPLLRVSKISKYKGQMLNHDAARAPVCQICTRPQQQLILVVVETMQDAMYQIGLNRSSKGFILYRRDYSLQTMQVTMSIGPREISFFTNVNVDRSSRDLILYKRLGL